MSRETGGATGLVRLVVVGAGAVGSSIGGLLAADGLPVVLVARGEHGRTLRRDGLRICLPDRRLSLAVPGVECVDRVGDVEGREQQPGEGELVHHPLGYALKNVGVHLGHGHLLQATSPLGG